MNFIIRPLKENDLSEADRIFRLAFGTFLGLPDPMTCFGDADYVRTRFYADPHSAYAVGTEDLEDGAVTTPKLADNAVTTDKIADNSITSTEPSESFMKRVTLLYNAAGNALGWNPDGGQQSFIITEPNADFDTSYISASVTNSRISGGGLFGIPCTAAPVLGGNAFNVRCGL